MRLWDIYKAIKVGRSDSLFASIAGIKLNKDAWKKGFNKWDEEWEVGTLTNQGANYPGTKSIRSKNHIPVTPGVEYHFKFPTWVVYYFYDESKQFAQRVVNFSNEYNVTIPSGVYYMRFCTNENANLTEYENNICINVSGEHDGEYVPYNG